MRDLERAKKRLALAEEKARLWNEQAMAYRGKGLVYRQLLQYAYTQNPDHFNHAWFRGLCKRVMPSAVQTDFTHELIELIEAHVSRYCPPPTEAE